MDVNIHRVKSVSFAKVEQLGSGTYSLSIEVEAFRHYNNDDNDVCFEHICLFSDDRKMLKRIRIE